MRQTFLHHDIKANFLFKRQPISAAMAQFYYFRSTGNNGRLTVLPFLTGRAWWRVARRGHATYWRRNGFYRFLPGRRTHRNRSLDGYSTQSRGYAQLSIMMPVLRVLPMNGRKK